MRRGAGSIESPDWVLLSTGPKIHRHVRNARSRRPDRRPAAADAMRTVRIRRHAGRMPRRSPQAPPTSIAARPAARPTLAALARLTAREATAARRSHAGAGSTACRAHRRKARASAARCASSACPSMRSSARQAHARRAHGAPAAAGDLCVAACPVDFHRDGAGRPRMDAAMRAPRVRDTRRGTCGFHRSAAIDAERGGAPAREQAVSAALARARARRSADSHADRAHRFVRRAAAAAAWRDRLVGAFAMPHACHRLLADARRCGLRPSRRVGDALSRRSSRRDRAWHERQRPRRRSRARRGLQRKFTDADQTLDGVQRTLDAQPARVRVRYLLERGPARQLEPAPTQAIAWFRTGAGRLRQRQLTGAAYYRVDALHMLAIASPREQQLDWHKRAIAAAASADDARTRGWRASLLPQPRLDAARPRRLRSGARLLAAGARRARSGNERAANAHRTLDRWPRLRSLGKLDDAEAMQRALVDELQAANAPDGYVFEELAGDRAARAAIARPREPWARQAIALLKESTLTCRPTTLHALRGSPKSPSPRRHTR